eukprot:4173363-Pyramimonas_sp.AAC.1
MFYSYVNLRSCTPKKTVFVIIEGHTSTGWRGRGHSLVRPRRCRQRRSRSPPHLPLLPVLGRHPRRKRCRAARLYAAPLAPSHTWERWGERWRQQNVK